MFGTNVNTQRLKRFGYDEATREAPLTRGVNIHELRIRFTALVTVAGGAADGALVEDGPARLLRQLTVDGDGFKYVNGVSGRDLYQLSRRYHTRIVEYTHLAAPGVQANTPVSCEIVVSFSPKWAANPYELFIPGALPVQQQLAAFLDFDSSQTTNASSKGSGALVTGGDRDVTISDFACEVTEISTVSQRMPQYVPVMESIRTAQFTAAADALELELKQSRRIAALFLQYRNGTLGDSQDGISHVILQASNVRKIDASYQAIKNAELRDFPAVPSTELGGLYLPFTHNGKLGQALDPRAFGTQPRLTFTVDAPAANPGRLEGVTVELAQRPPHTIGQ